MACGTRRRALAHPRLMQGVEAATSRASSARAARPTGRRPHALPHPSARRRGFRLSTCKASSTFIFFYLSSFMFCSLLLLLFFYPLASPPSPPPVQQSLGSLESVSGAGVRLPFPSRSGNGGGSAGLTAQAAHGRRTGEAPGGRARGGHARGREREHGAAPNAGAAGRRRPPMAPRQPRVAAGGGAGMSDAVPAGVGRERLPTSSNRKFIIGQSPSRLKMTPAGCLTKRSPAGGPDYSLAGALSSPAATGTGVRPGPAPQVGGF